MAGILISGLGDAYTNSGYNLIIYADTDRRGTSNNARQSLYTVTPDGGSAIQVFNEDDDISSSPNYNTFDGSYVESDGIEDGADYSNYVIVSNLTASSFTLAWSSPDGGRGGISGFQIVANAPLVTSIDNFGVGVVSGKVALSWTAVTGASYGVEATDNLVIGTWTSIASGLSGNGLLSITNDVTADQQFFRAYLED
jgi:hypothetical protein